MEEIEIASGCSIPKWIALRDARQKSIINSQFFSQKEKLKAERVRGVLELMYRNTGIYVNYRQKFVAIKIDNPKAFLSAKDTLKEFEEDWSKQGITKRTSGQGIIYRIPRN